MRKLVLIVVIVFGAYAAMAVATIVGTYRWNLAQGGTLADFVKLSAIWTALLAGGLTAFMSVLILLTQQTSATALERLRTEWARNLELTKLTFARVGKACDEMSSAAVQLYYCLAPLERGERVSRSCDDVEKEMTKAAGFLPALDDETRLKWYAYWQCARRVKELSTDLSSPVERKTLWAERGADPG
jgi:hypothetical protein